jgi:hypothetical protein
MGSDDAVTERGREAHAAHVDLIWQTIREHLDGERRRVVSEISAYPTPIAGCDAQFTALLEQREQLAQELRQWDAFRSHELADTEVRAHVEAFLGQSEYVPDHLSQGLRLALALAWGPLDDATVRTASDDSASIA